MREHEKEHYEFFDKEIQKRNIKPTRLLPLWDLMGITLGFGAMMGKKSSNVVHSFCRRSNRRTL